MNNLIEAISLVSSSDWIIASAGFSLIVIFLLASEYFGKKYKISSPSTRKFIHISTGIILCSVAFLLVSNIPLLLFASMYILIDFWAIHQNKFKSIHPDKNSLGTTFYAITVFLLAMIFWNGSKPLFIITNMIMILPDAMAAIIGSRYARSFIKPLGEKKSLIGAATMFSLTGIIVFSLTMLFYNLSVLPALTISFITGAIATAAELLSMRGSDNLSVPLLSALFLYAFLIMPSSENLVFGVVAGAVVGFYSFRLKFLDTGGSLLAFLMGSMIFGIGGWLYTLPILVFFISASILSKIGRQKKITIEEGYQKTNVRDFFQVLANGGLPTLIVIYIFLSRQDQFYPVYIVAIAAATADTWATELGIYSRKHPFLLTTWKRVGPGTSGAISIPGTLAALGGSALIMLSVWPFIKIETNLSLYIILIGWGGSFFDSLMGATIQAQYRCINCKNITENKNHCQVQGDLVKGYSWMDNDLVNIFSIILASTMMYIYMTQ